MNTRVRTILICFLACLLAPASVSAIYYHSEFNGTDYFAHMEALKERIGIATIKNSVAANDDDPTVLIGAGGIVKERGIVKGGWFWKLMGEKPFVDLSAEYFEQAIRLDPENYAAYAGLLDTYLVAQMEYKLNYADEIDALVRRARVSERENALYDLVASVRSLDSANGEDYLQALDSALAKDYVSIYSLQNMKAKKDFLISLGVMDELTARWVTTLSVSEIPYLLGKSVESLIEKGVSAESDNRLQEAEQIANRIQRLADLFERSATRHSLGHLELTIKKVTCGHLKNYYSGRNIELSEKFSHRYAEALKKLELVGNSNKFLDAELSQDIHQASKEELGRLFDIYYEEDFLEYRIECGRIGDWRKPLWKKYPLSGLE